METQHRPLDRLLTRSEVEQVVGLKSSSIYAKVKEGVFPAPVRISTQAVRWRESDIREWMDSLPTEIPDDRPDF